MEIQLWLSILQTKYVNHNGCRYHPSVFDNSATTFVEELRAAFLVGGDAHRCAVTYITCSLLEHWRCAR